MKSSFILIILSFFFLTACDKDETPDSTLDVDRGVLVANQGKFPDGSGAITWIKDGATQANDLYNIRNEGSALGNTVQSVFYNAERYFIAVNNASSVVVADRKFKRVKTFENMGYTRYFAAWGNKVVASSWGAGTGTGKLYVINEALEIEQTIEVNGAPEKMLVNGSELWVSLSNGFGVDSVVARYDLPTARLKTLTTVDKGPNSFAIDNFGKVLVLCEGYFDWLNNISIPGGLYVLAPDGSAIKLISVPQGSTNLCFNPKRQSFYFNSFSDIYEYRFGEPALNTIILPVETSSVYGLALDVPNNILYYSDPKDFASQGTVFSINLENQKTEKYPASIVPGQIFVRN